MSHFKKRHSASVGEPICLAGSLAGDHSHASHGGNFSHNSKLATNEPQWSAVDRARLPRAAFADPGLIAVGQA